MAPEPSRHVALILNHAWMVRHYFLQRTPVMRAQRAAAIIALGHAVRVAFNECREENFESLLAAVCDGLRPRDEQPF